MLFLPRRSDVPGDTHRARRPREDVVLIDSNPQPRGHPTSDYLAEHQALPQDRAHAMHADFDS